MTDLSIISSLNHRAAALANRWVKAMHEPWAHPYHAMFDKIDPDNQLIVFTERCVDGVGFAPQGSISTRYLDDDSTLERDAKAWKAAESARLAARTVRIDQLKVRPEVIEYMCLSTQSAFSVPGIMGYTGYGPYWGEHELNKVTPKPFVHVGPHTTYVTIPLKAADVSD